MSPEPDPHCNDCGAPIGEAHLDACDVARCLATGMQRLSCGEEHDCGDDTWTGHWPGKLECEEFGWFAEFVPYGGWVSCDRSNPKAMHDLNRLVIEATWDPSARRWVRPA